MIFKKVYNAIRKMLSCEKYELFDSDRVDFVLFYISLLPITYEDVSSIKILFDDLKLRRLTDDSIDDYILNERVLINSLWEYKAIRSLAMSDDAISNFLLGCWTTESYYPSITFKSSSVDIEGLPTPNVASKYYDIQDCVYVYTNGNDVLCKVFKFTISNEDPNKMTVFAFENSKIYVLERHF